MIYRTFTPVPPPGVSKWRMTALLIALTFASTLFTLYQTGKDAWRYPGTDLRDKVIGARRLLEGKNPYYKPWQQFEPEHVRMFTRNTYTPPLLALYAPLCELPYKIQRIFYAALDWVEVLLCALVLWRVFPDLKRSLLLSCAFLLLTVPNFSFLLHVERGQYYVLILLLSTVAAVCVLRSRFPGVAVGCICLLVLIRPTFLITLACLFLLGQRRLVAKCSLIIAAVIVALLPVITPKVWGSYFESMGEAQAFELTAVDRFPLYMAPFQALGSHVADGLDFDKVKDDLWYHADRCVVVSTYRGELAWRIRKLGLTGSRIVNKLNLTLLLLTSLALCSLAAYWNRRPVSPTAQLALVFSAPTIIETFGPQRNCYCDVTVCCSVMLVLIGIMTRKRWRFESAILACAFILSVVFPLFELVAPGVFPKRAHGWIADLRWLVLLGGVVAYMLLQLPTKIHSIRLFTLMHSNALAWIGKSAAITDHERKQLAGVPVTRHIAPRI